MITAAHFIIYAHDAEKARAFFRDVLNLPSVDAGRGWLIFKLPPGEVAAHPIDEGESHNPEEHSRCEMYLMCDDLHQTMDQLKRKGVEFTGPVHEAPWGSLIMLTVPGAGRMGLYQPKHPTAHDLA